MPSTERNLLRQALAGPRGLPEQLALFAVRHRGEAARRTVAALPADGEHADRYREVIRRGRRATASEGAFVGGPMLVFAPFAFCAALLRQSRTVLELAALDGRGLRLTTLWDLTWRMARLLGLLTPTTGRSRWWAQAGRLLLTCTVILVGMVAPLVWLPYLAVSYDRATDRLSRWP